MRHFLLFPQLGREHWLLWYPFVLKLGKCFFEKEQNENGIGNKDFDRFFQFYHHSLRFQLGSIRCKHIVRWQHLSRIKARLLWLVENVFSPIKTQQATSGTSAATY